MEQIFRIRLLQIFATVFFLAWAPGHALSQIDVKLPDGFSIAKVAGDELATNIFCMTLNSHGQPVVSGPGYIKTLIDTNGDGIFDNAKVFASAPATGAQGMHFEGTDLLCTGDAGLLLFKDADGDGTADGPPQTIMPVKTGGEHLAHAIKRGPDGWFYMMAGNQTPILPEYFNGQNSPVKNPQAGFLMRLSPDFKTREIVAHGFRNAYDFDFNSAGEIFVYDSDGERDITLPWYRPTRVYQVRPGDHAGWISAGWKRPSDYFDMPTEVGALGRGSPTGVCCYNRDRFPSQYRDAIFVADWTFGRIVVFKRDPQTTKYDRGTGFAVSQGQFGFAVTDLVVASDGSLLVSVGGRGTAGGVYRISCQSAELPGPQLATKETDEYLNTLRSMSGHSWDENSFSLTLLALTTNDKDIQVAALESLVGRNDYLQILNDTHRWMLNSAIKRSLSQLDKTQARLVFNIIKSWPDEMAKQICDDVSTENEGDLLIRIAGSREPEERAALLIDCLALLNTSSVNREFVLRLAQLTMDGCGPGGQGPPVFHGYAPRQELEFTPSQKESLVAHLKALHALFNNDAKSLRELLRIMAMVGEQLPKDLEFTNPESDTVSGEIHRLICAARIQSRFPRDAIVRSLLELNAHAKSQHEETDRNWTPRLQELAKRLIEKYGISPELIETETFGAPEHVYLHKAVAKQWKSASKNKFEAAISKNPSAATIEQFRIVTSQPNELNRELVKLCAAQPNLRDEAILALAGNPNAEDIELYKQGLASLDARVVKRSAIALRRLPGILNDGVQIGAFEAACRLGWDKQSVAVRDQLVLLLRKQTGQQFGYLPKSADQIQNGVLDAWRKYLLDKFPDEKRLQAAAPVELLNILDAVDWPTGDINRGRELYKQRQCALCHNGGSRQGPRLEGITNRFSKRDLFQSIVRPHEQVPDRYRATIVETTDGLIYKGIIIYESVDGVTLMEGSGKTVRINKADIEDRLRTQKSLMPERLLDNVDAQGFADLFAFLKSQKSN